jgi:hypothetical protein
MVQPFGDQLLARPALTDHKDRTIERRGAAGAFDRVEKGQARADEIVGPLHPISWWISRKLGKPFQLCPTADSGRKPQFGQFLEIGTDPA